MVNRFPVYTSRMLTYEQWLAALCLWREGRGLTMEALAGIWEVIQNRATDSRKLWPGSIAGVILQHSQFSSFLQSDPNVTKFPLPSFPPSPDWSAWERCVSVVSQPAGNTVVGANHYESLPPDAPRPAWADPDKITATIGPIRFYRL